MLNPLRARDDRLCSPQAKKLEVEGLAGAASGKEGHERQTQRNGYRSKI
jgi:hypothetical protein